MPAIGSHLVANAVMRTEQVACTLPQVALHFVLWLVAALIVDMHESTLNFVQGFHLQTRQQ